MRRLPVVLASEIGETIDMCRHCFMCRHANPTFLVTKLDAHTPRGYALAMSRIEDGHATWSADLATKLYQSTLDGLCSELCEFGWREDLVVQAGRQAARQAGVAQTAVVLAADRRISEGTAMPDLPQLRDRLDREGASVLYLTGLEARDRAPATIAATAALLDHLGVDWTALSVERDPGLDLWELGYTDEAAAAARRFVANVVRLDPAMIVTGSSRVIRALREPLPGALAGLPHGQHLSEFLAERLDASGDGATVAYHDPCSLGRRLRVFDPPREVIRRLTGHQPVEFAHDRAVAECCGEGGLLPEIDPELAARLADAQLGRIPDGVATLVTACPGCRVQLASAAGRSGGEVRVLDLSELAAERFGLLPADVRP
jgi:Fe-S oxidoreductase